MSMDDFFATVQFTDKGKDWRDVKETAYDPDEEDTLRERVKKSVQKTKGNK